MTSDNENDDEEYEEPQHTQSTQIRDKRKQRRFTIQEKASIIRTVERLMEQHGMSRREACADLNISSGMHWAWKKQMNG